MRSPRIRIILVSVANAVLAVRPQNKQLQFTAGLVAHAMMVICSPRLLQLSLKSQSPM